MDLVKDIESDAYATRDNRYGIERAGWYWICWRLVIGRKTYYQRQISNTMREPIYFKSFISASDYLAGEIEKDKERIIYSA